MRKSSVVILAFINLVVVPLLVLLMNAVFPTIGIPIFVGVFLCFLFQLAFIETLLKVDRIIRANQALFKGR